jgi:hypothetical protein
MRWPFLAMLHAFAATRCEDKDAVHEESRGHHARHGMPDPSRGRGSECVGSSSECETTRSLYVGMPGEPLETPDEDNALPTMQSRRSRTHAPSLLLGFGR